MAYFPRNMRSIERGAKVLADILVALLVLVLSIAFFGTLGGLAAFIILETALLGPSRAEARVPAKHDGTVAQTGTVSSVDEENPLQIKRTRYLCQTGPSLDTVYGAQAVCVSANR
jgi:hypothetical protein